LERRNYSVSAVKHIVILTRRLSNERRPSRRNEPSDFRIRLRPARPERQEFGGWDPLEDLADDSAKVRQSGGGNSSLLSASMRRLAGCKVSTLQYAGSLCIGRFDHVYASCRRISPLTAAAHMASALPEIYKFVPSRQVCESDLYPS
jgi:hypothetical protein